MDNRARHQAILITGANGEMGHGLIHALAEQNVDLVAVDLHPLDPALRPKVRAHQAGDILDTQLMQRLVSQYEVTTIFHLAALLSTRAEFSPEIAHRVNVTGTLELLRLAHQQSTWSGVRTKFIFPSSIAAYGVAGMAALALGLIDENKFRSWFKIKKRYEPRFKHHQIDVYYSSYSSYLLNY